MFVELPSLFHILSTFIELFNRSPGPSVSIFYISIFDPPVLECVFSELPETWIQQRLIHGLDVFLVHKRDRETSAKAIASRRSHRLLPLQARHDRSDRSSVRASYRSYRTLRAYSRPHYARPTVRASCRSHKILLPSSLLRSLKDIGSVQYAIHIGFFHYTPIRCTYDPLPVLPAVLKGPISSAVYSVLELLYPCVMSVPSP